MKVGRTRDGLTVVILIVGLSIFPAWVNAAGTGYARESGVRIRVRPRSPSQIAAFYEARGFPQAALKKLSEACFMTVSIVNGRRQVLWLEPTRWILQDSDGRRLQPILLDNWMNRWSRLGVSAASQSAFRWTQLPGSRDLRPDEPVGGNLSVLPPKGLFTLEARFRLGKDKSEGLLVIQLPGLRCPGRQPAAK